MSMVEIRIPIEYTLLGRVFKILIILMSNLSPKYPPN
jgi:hypothetical protein